MKNIRTLIREKLKIVSRLPGVYLMIDSSGTVIYVGKALNLKTRIASYFGGNDAKNNPKIISMISKVANFETIITNSEKEALILEENLIKKIKPKYNIILKDDKRYPFLRISNDSFYPYLEVVRKTKKDNSHYFGPFTSINNFHKTVKMINRTFKLRKCNGKNIKKSRPCINYQIGTCLGPCYMPVDKDIYTSIVNEVLLILKGKTSELIRNIYAQMNKAAFEQKFELAASFRDKLFAVKKTLEHQVIVSNDFIDRDVLGLMYGIEYSVITILFVRRGVIQGKEHFKFRNKLENETGILSKFILQYYRSNHYIPNEIIVPETPQDSKLIQEIFYKKKTLKVKIIKPIKGNKKKLLEMANLNAKSELKLRTLQIKNTNEMLTRLKNRLEMDRIPCVIECFDNSNFSGTKAVSASVVFRNGKPVKSSYRKYTIKAIGKYDDYTCMKEVLTRRYNGSNSFLPLPDLLMVDGGKGQLNIALSVFKKMNVSGKTLIISIAKKNQVLGEETDKIYLPNKEKPLRFGKREKEFLYLQQIRDEAHRCAISFQRHLRNKTTIKSVLDKIKGIGTKRKALLLKQFGSVKNIRTAPIKKIMELPGISKSLAVEIKKKLL